MNPLLPTTVLMVCLLSGILSGCNTAPLYEVNKAPFGAGPLSSQAVEKAIIRAGKRTGWQISRIRRGRMIGKFQTAKNKHLAVVEIEYTPTTYSIRYNHSLNLKYRPPPAATQTNSPFNLDSLPGTRKPTGPTIHKVYNQWVAALESAILTEVKKTGVASPATATSHPLSSTTVSSSCPTPHPESFRGRGIIKTNRANLRDGPSTHCTKVGFLRHGSEFEIFGRQGKWFLIAAPTGEAWVHASLVGQRSMVAEPAPPTTSVPLPQKSGKKATIAVIQFKTLNREAQEINLGDLISESFTTELVNSRAFKIIERAQLDKVVKEIELSQTGFIDTSQAVEIGKMLNADAIITGSVALLSGKLQLNARIIDIESAYVLSAESRTFPYRLEEINRGVREIVFSLSRKFRNRR